MALWRVRYSLGDHPDPICGTWLLGPEMVVLTDGDASSSVGIAFGLLVRRLSESVSEMPALRDLLSRDDREGGVSYRSTLGGGDLLSDGDIDNKPCTNC